MITPEQVAEAIKSRREIFRMSCYSTSESRIVAFKPTAINFSSDKEWIVTDPTEGTTISINDLYASRYDALIADANRLEAVARQCERIADQLRKQASKERPTTTAN